MATKISNPTSRTSERFCPNHLETALLPSRRVCKLCEAEEEEKRQDAAWQKKVDARYEKIKAAVAALRRALDKPRSVGLESTFVGLIRVACEQFENDRDADVEAGLQKEGPTFDPDKKQRRLEDYLLHELLRDESGECRI